MITRIEFDFTETETPIAIEKIIDGAKWRGNFSVSAEELGGIVENEDFADEIVSAYNGLVNNN